MQEARDTAAHLNLSIGLVGLHVALVGHQVAHELAGRDGKQLGGVDLVGQQAGQRVDGQASPQSLLLAVHHVRLPVHLRRDIARSAACHR